MPRSQKEMENLAALARLGSRQALTALRQEFSPSLVRIVQCVRDTGGEDLAIHRQIRAVIAAFEDGMAEDERLPERELVAAAADWLWDRTESRLLAGAAMDTIPC